MIKMGKYKYVQSFVDRHGRERHYFRRAGKRIALPAPEGSAPFERAYAAALSGSVPKPRNDKTIAHLVGLYKETPRFIGMKESTQSAYCQQLNEIEDQWGAFPADGLTRLKVNELMANRAHDKKRANRIHKRLRALMEYAVEIGWIDTNPVGRTRPYRVEVKGHRTWPESQIAKFHEHWKRGTPERLAFDLLLYLGQRAGDTANMSRLNIKSGRVRIKQEKTSTTLWISIHGDLQKTLNEGPVGSHHFIETAYGRCRSVKGLYNFIKKALRAAGCDDDLSPHGLRKAAATRLADTGCSSAQICAVTGHKSIQEMEKYIRERNQIKLADEAILKLPSRD